MSFVKLDKLITSNRTIKCAIGTIINEYDIKAAHTSACYFIYGKEMFDKLMSMPKLDRNSYIGKMQAKDRSIYKKIEEYLLKWMNNFFDVNGIRDTNFVETTRDSVLLINKKPSITTFENGIVNFRNKEGEYSSLYRIDKNRTVLFDSMSYNFRIKGIDVEVTNSSPFIKKYYIPLLATIENNHNDIIKLLKQLSIFRMKYIYAEDPDIYRDVLENNKFIQELPDGSQITCDCITDLNKIQKINNFKNFVMPVMQMALNK